MTTSFSRACGVLGHQKYQAATRATSPWTCMREGDHAGVARRGAGGVGFGDRGAGGERAADGALPGRMRRACLRSVAFQSGPSMSQRPSARVAAAGLAARAGGDVPELEAAGDRGRAARRGGSGRRACPRAWRPGGRGRWSRPAARAAAGAEEAGAAAEVAHQDRRAGAPDAAGQALAALEAGRARETSRKASAAP